MLTTGDVYDAFYDEYAKLNAFLHSHSYTGNPLACAAARATLGIFESTAGDRAQSRAGRAHGAGDGAACRTIRMWPRCGSTGMILAIEMVKDRATREPYDFRERRGLRVYRHALERGVLLRPIGNVLYFMPPYVITPEEIDLLADVARTGIEAATCA